MNCPIKLTWFKYPIWELSFTSTSTKNHVKARLTTTTKIKQKFIEFNQVETYRRESSTSTSVLASISPAPLPSEAAWPVLSGTTFFSCFIFQPSTLSFQATLPNPGEPNSLTGSVILILATKQNYQQTKSISERNEQIHERCVKWERGKYVIDWHLLCMGGGVYVSLLHQLQEMP